MRDLQKEIENAKGYKSEKMACTKLEMAFNAGWMTEFDLPMTVKRKADGRYVPVVIINSRGQSHPGALAHRGIFVTN